MNRIKSWISNNKITTILLIAVIYFVAKQSVFTLLGTQMVDMNYGVSDSVRYAEPSTVELGTPTSMGSPRVSNPSSGYNPTPQLNENNRMTVTSSRLSILVLDVREATTSIQQHVQSLNGYVVNSNVRTPTEGGTGSVTFRVPLENRESMLQFLREVGIKVISENIDSNDVTDEYMDIEGRLATLQQTKARYQEIMASATDVDEILKVQQYIFRVDDEIDILVGRRNYLESTSQSTLITVYLSTDELALPYTPEDTWRPEVVFKLAVRALIGVMQSIGSAIIWLGVFSVIWIPLVLVYFAIKKARRRNKV